MCLPPQTKTIQRPANASAAPPPKQPEAAYAQPAAYAAPAPPQPVYAPFYHAPAAAVYQPYAPVYASKYGMEEPTLFEGLPFPDASLGFGDFVAEPKEAVLQAPDVADSLDFSWLYGRQPSAESPPSAVPELAALSPFEEVPFGSCADVSSEDFLNEESPLSHMPSATNNARKQRKRKLASDLSPEELAKTREINRLAAQRHRHIAKQKQSERQERYDAMGQRNEKLRQEIQQITTELNTLKRLVVSMYGAHGPRHTALVSHMVLPSMAILRPHTA